MNSYRLVLLLKSDLKKEAKDKLYTEIKKWLGDVKDEKVELLGEKKLAYTIKHAKKGEYVVLNFESGKVDNELNKKLLIRDEILRHLLIRN